MELIRRHIGAATIAFTNRRGGSSLPPFDALNLADHVGDDPAVVIANRRAVAAALDVPDAPWVMAHHVHGTEVLSVTGVLGDGVEADGVATNRPGLLLAALGADCAPIAIANDTASAAIHAGWRGAAKGVIASGVSAVCRLGSGPIRAVVGPCVCAAHYEFGDALLADLVARLGPEVATTTVHDTPAFDLRAAIRIAFTRAEVHDVEILDVCTVESPDYYSYRRDGVTGRHGVVVVQR